MFQSFQGGFEGRGTEEAIVHFHLNSYIPSFLTGCTLGIIVIVLPLVAEELRVPFESCLADRTLPGKDIRRGGGFFVVVLEGGLVEEDVLGGVAEKGVFVHTF